MKKILLTIGALALSISFVDAQVLTYVGQNANMFVSSGTLLYSGGDFQLDANIDKTVENKGNITIVGNYLKGTTTSNAAVDGKEFVNDYTSANDYGQVQILGGATGTNAKMTMQKPPVPTGYFGATFPIAFPYQDDVGVLMTSFGKPASTFIGSCAIGQFCGQSIFAMTLRRWNNNLVVNDVVPTGATFKAGDYYLLNMRNSDMQANMTNPTGNVVGYKGTPAPLSYTSTVLGVIKDQTAATFSPMAYNDWKGLGNAYNESYESYLGYQDTSSPTYGKNVYRFGNPYTSNLDLSDVSTGGPKSWISFINAGNVGIDAATGVSIIGFYITKRTDKYAITWNPITGSSDNNSATSPTYYKALYNKALGWTGAKEALLIKPFETFNLNFTQLNYGKLGGYLVNATVNFNDNHKTYSYIANAAAAAPGGNLPQSVSGASAMKVMSATAAAQPITNSSNFVQAEIFLVDKDINTIGTPVFIAGNDLASLDSEKGTVNNPIYVNGFVSKSETIAYDQQRDITVFNTNTYAGKPLALGFNDLKAGQSYELRFSLFEGSIFNEVKDLSTDKFYLLDKSNNTVTPISATSTYKFTPTSANEATRFEVYWREYNNSTLGTGESVKTSNSTVVYKDAGVSKVRFERVAKANVQVYDMGGRLINNAQGISTASDYTLPLVANGVYIVKVTYENGDVRTLKAIK